MIKDRWKNLDKGVQMPFGMIQLDIKNHSDWKGADSSKRKTKSNLKNVLSNICAIYDFKVFSWNGDGGVFYIPIKDQEKDYDLIVQCSMHILNEINLFNKLEWQNRLKDPIYVRICCDIVCFTYTEDLSTIHSEQLNFFIKNERKMSEIKSITVTNKLYEQLTDRSFIEQFEVLDEEIEGINENLFRYRDYEGQNENLYTYKEMEWNDANFIMILRNAEFIDIFASGSNTYYDIFYSIFNKRGKKIFENLKKVRILFRKREGGKNEEYLYRWTLLCKELEIEMEYKLYDFLPFMMRGMIIDNSTAYIGFYLRKKVNSDYYITQWGSQTPLLVFVTETPMFRYSRKLFDNLWEDFRDGN